MKDWFKARNIWGAGILSLSDEEAGQFVKALWQYTMNGEVIELSGAAKGIMAIAMMTLSADDDAANALSATRAAAGAKGGLQKVANQANATIAKQEIANDSNCFNKNKNKNKEEDIKENIKEKSGRFTPPTIEQVKEYCQERGNTVDPDRWFNYYSSNGWKVGKNPMKDWKAAVRTWENNDKQDNRPAGKVVQVLPAQNYNQRSYNETKDVNAFYAELMKRQETS